MPRPIGASGQTLDISSHFAEGKLAEFTHGLGVGDVNGDGSMDILEKDGWWEQPASLAGDPVWKFHPLPLRAESGRRRCMPMT